MEENRRKKNRNSKRRIARQWLAVGMILAMFTQSVTGISYGAPLPGDREEAAYTSGPCPHHTRHTEECGYQEANPCSHAHGAECYEIYGGISDVTPSNATSSNATPSNAASCTHTHDRDCGYAAGHACEYHCKICAGEELTLEEQAKAMEAQNKTQSIAKRFGRSNRQTFTTPSALTPFVIGSEVVLRELADKVNSGQTWANGEITYAESSYVLTGDIRLTGDWTPIGTEEKPFTGTFDGDGYVVSDMMIHDTSLKDSGLFGYVKGGTVEDLGVKDADILAGSDAYNTGVFWDASHAGAVAGTLDGGTVRRCYSTGSVNAATGAEYLTAGGIVGVAGRGSSVESCYSTGNVLANSAGGIAGVLENSDLENCYSTGKIAAYRHANAGAAVGGGIAGTLFADGGRTQLTGSIAFNSSIDGSRISTGRCYGVDGMLGSGGVISAQNLYAFFGMKVRGSVVTDGNQQDEKNGADLEYNATDQTFSTSWKDIFSDMSVWDMKQGKLPTLKGIGGQDGEMPEWLLTGQAADLYIGSEAELIAFRDRVNGTNGKTPETFAGKTVRLTADITLSSGSDWVPIGDGELDAAAVPGAKFCGKFDGGGHTVSGVRIGTDRKCAGLFGYVEGGVIENLGVKDVDIMKSGNSDFDAGAIAGSIAGNTVIRRCYSTGSITGGVSAGGVVGQTTAGPQIEDCYSTAAVKAWLYAGGVVGYFNSDDSGNGSLKNCYSTGSVEGQNHAGGIAGYMRYSNPHLAALNQSVKGAKVDTHRIVGRIESNSTGTGNGTGSYAFSGMEVNGKTVTGGTEAKDGADLSYDPVTKAFSPDWETIFDGVSAWDIGPGKLPTLKGIGGQDGKMPEWLLTGQAADLYIGSEAELIAFRDRVNGTNGKAPENFSGQTVRLTADITLSNDTDWVPIGISISGQQHMFYGTFDGGGHVIRNVRIIAEDQDNLGLFCGVLEGTIQNLGVENVQIRGRLNVGGLAGYVGVGTSISNCYSTGSVTGEAFVGGLVGMTYGMVQGASASDIITIKNCWHAGTVEQVETMDGVTNPEYYKTAGGIAGAIIAGTGLEHCYSAENMVAGFTAGGIVGRNVLNDLAGGMNCNAALSMAVDGEDGAGRIFGELDNPSGKSFCRENYAYSGMTVNGKTVTGDGGAGKNGRDAAVRDIVMNETLFPDSDWIREDGYYPRLRVFGEKNRRPLGTWLKEQAEGAFHMTLTPDSHKFPDAKTGYGAQAAAVFTVENAGTQKLDGLKAELTGHWTDGSMGTATPYFVLAGTETLAGIDAGKTASFTVTPAAGLPEGNYRATVLVTGKYGLKAEAKVEFAVKAEAKPDPDPEPKPDPKPEPKPDPKPEPKPEPTPQPEPEPTPQPEPDGDSDEGPVTVKPPAHSYINGEVPSSAGSGNWEKLPGGGWRFYKDGSAEAGTGKDESGNEDGRTGVTGDGGAAGGAGASGMAGGPGASGADGGQGVSGATGGQAVSGATGGPGTAGGTGGERYAVKEWLYIGGFWYLFGEDGRMVTGWACVNGIWYYLSTAEYAAANPGRSTAPDGMADSGTPRLKEGAMVTGWFLDPKSGLWYWLEPSGAMAVGWREIDGKRYYFNPESDGTRGKWMEDAAAD